MEGQGHEFEQMRKAGKFLVHVMNMALGDGNMRKLLRPGQLAKLGRECQIPEAQTVGFVQG